MVQSDITMTLPQVYNLATQVLQAGRPAEAASILDALLTKNPTHVPSLVARGLAYIEADEPMKALIQAERARLVDPAYAPLYELACIALKDMGRTRDAESWCEKGLEMNPNSAFLLFYKARMCADEGNVAQARTLCEKALTINPDAGPAKQLLATL